MHLLLRFSNTVRLKSSLLVGVPMVLAAFTHLWSPIGFPSIYVDEAHYMRRAMNILEGQGPQESAKVYHHPYDHPYFGQLFLASILGVFDYPNSLNLSGSGNTEQSIEMLYMFPRIVMGILAVIDTLFVFKIAERRYSKKVAFIASILFAVMPLGWFVRRIWLESIQLPLLLASILLVTRGSNKQKTNNVSRDTKEDRILLVLISGILLGLSIFTKVPAVTMIPLVGYLVYTANNRNLMMLGLWSIPVISIALVWPAFAFSHGQFDVWSADLLWQASRAGEGDTVSEVIIDLFKIDPILLILGAAGIILSVIKKDLFLFLWTLPYIIFSYSVVHSSYWYFIPLLPAFCIGAARLIEIITSTVGRKEVQQFMTFGIVLVIAIFGFVSTTMLITTNVSSSYFKAAAYIVHNLPILNGYNENQVLVTGGSGLASYTWIPLQIIELNHDYRMLHILFSSNPTATNATEALFVVDKLFDNTMKALMNLQKNHELGSLQQLLQVYNSTETIATFEGNTNRNDTETYPYFAMKFNNQLTPSGPDRIDIRSNYHPT